MSAAEQRLEEIGDCRYGLWAIGVEQNDQGMPFLCAVHPVGVHVTLSAVSGGSFRCRGEQQKDTLYFKDGSSKASATANAQNVSAPRCNILLRRVSPEDIPEQTPELRAGVVYRYGDHWSLTVADTDYDVGTLECFNEFKELMMKTTFDGRPVTKPYQRYDDQENGKSYSLKLRQSSDVVFTDAHRRTKEIFNNPERT